MSNQDKYEYINKNYKSIDRAMLLINNKNIYSLYKKYRNTVRHYIVLNNKEGVETIYPEFTNDLILLTNLIYNEITKNLNNGFKN